MDKKDKNTNIEFYKEQYLFEYERGKTYDKSIQFVTTLLIVFIAAVAYSFKEYFTNGIVCIETNVDWLFLILLILFSISIIITIFFISIVFFGFTRKYDFLPSTIHLFEYEKELYRHHYKYETGTYEERRIKAKNLTRNDFEKSLKKYYIEMTTLNQNINDKRSNNYYLTRILLFIDLVLLILIATIGFLFTN